MCIDELMQRVHQVERKLWWAERMVPFAAASKTTASQGPSFVRRRVLGEAESPVVLHEQSASGQQEVAAELSSVLEGSPAAAAVAAASVAETPFGVAEVALEAAARMQSARRMRQRHRHLGKETWEKYAEIYDGQDFRGRVIEPEPERQEPLTELKRQEPERQEPERQQRVYSHMTVPHVAVDLPQPAERADAAGVDLWKQRQTSSQMFTDVKILQRGGVFYTEPAPRVPAWQPPQPEPEPESSGVRERLSAAHKSQTESVEKLLGLTGAQSSVALDAGWHGEMEKIRDRIEDITLLQLSNARAAVRESSSTAPRMRLTPRGRNAEQLIATSIRHQPRDAPAGV